MLSRTVQDALNEQIKHEMYSAYLYLAMSAYSEASHYPGLAHWTRLQAQEEVAHAMRLFDYLLARGGRVVLHAIDKPPADFSSPLEVAEQTFAHERMVTGLIQKLYETAQKENDTPTVVQLQWFISEQVEEEKNAEDLVEMFKRAGDHPGALFVLDRELASRKGE